MSTRGAYSDVAVIVGFSKYNRKIIAASKFIAEIKPMPQMKCSLHLI
jgi:hypothetical protein